VSLADVIGWAGALALLAAYALLGWNRLHPTSIGYIGLNLAGSAGLAVNGVVHAAWPSTALNLLWLVIGLVGWRRRHRPRDEPLPCACGGVTAVR
jgi:hypothetical protein